MVLEGTWYHTVSARTCCLFRVAQAAAEYGVSDPHSNCCSLFVQKLDSEERALAINEALTEMFTKLQALVEFQVCSSVSMVYFRCCFWLFVRLNFIGMKQNSKCRPTL